MRAVIQLFCKAICCFKSCQQVWGLAVPQTKQVYSATVRETQRSARTHILVPQAIMTQQVWEEDHEKHYNHTTAQLLCSATNEIQWKFSSVLPGPVCIFAALHVSRYTRNCNMTRMQGLTRRLAYTAA